MHSRQAKASTKERSVATISLVAAFVFAMLLATSQPSAAVSRAADGDATATAIRTARGCLVTLSGSLTADPSRVSDVLSASVDAQCNVKIERHVTNKAINVKSAGGHLASQALYTSRGCSSANTTYRFGGSMVIRLSNRLDFQYDGTYVQSYTTYSVTPDADYSSGMYVASGPTLNASHTSVPSTDNYVDHGATFNDQWGWYSDKDNYLHAYGSGSCYLSYSSNGLVPWGGGVSADLTYY